MVLHVAPSAEVSIRYVLPYAASHLRFTCVMVLVAPRSTRIHCGSDPSALAHRVPVLPSNASAAPSDDDSTDDEVAGLPCDSRVSVAASAPCMTRTVVTVPVTSRAAAPRPASLRGWFTRRL